jgi:peptide/nickel transport system permease protein
MSEIKSSRPPPPAPPPETSRAAFAALRRDRAAVVGALVLALLAFVAAFADLLASDLPVVARVQGTTHLFPCITRPAELAGWDNARIAREAAPGDFAIYPVVPYGPTQTPSSEATVLARPSLAQHPLGTDRYGRDVFARVVHGARTTLTVALAAVAAFVFVGAVLGAFAGFFGGVLDAFVARLIEVISAFPTLILVLVVQAVIPHPTVLSLLAALALTRWPEVARLVRAEVILAKAQDYVLAARALGASPWRVLTRHVAPNARVPTLVAGTFGIAQVVLIEAALDFLRVGLPAPIASWGEILSELREHAGAWWLLVFPGLAVFGTVVALNLVGEALRDALDPRLRAS